MRKNNNTIEINGKRYDAKTGALLNMDSVKPARPRPQPVVRRTPPAPPIPKTAARVSTRQAAKPIASRSPAPSRTLMRKAVSKPGASLKRRHKAQGDTDALASRRLGEVIVKPSALSLDEQRLRHAKQIPKSQLISRFPAITSDSGSTAGRVVTPAMPSGQAPQPARPVAASPLPAKQPKTTADLLQRAVDQASSHLEPPVRPQKYRRHDRLKRNTGIGAAIALSVVLLGVIVTQNLDNVRLQMASSKAGFNVSLPGYHPAGYGLGQLNYSQGAADVEFHSNSNSDTYTITQKSSPWDSSSLLNNFIKPSYAQYQTVTAGGLTIYIYGDNDATWVNGGIWYVIQSNGSLNDRQLVDLATSL